MPPTSQNIFGFTSCTNVATQPSLDFNHLIFRINYFTVLWIPSSLFFFLSCCFYCAALLSAMLAYISSFWMFFSLDCLPCFIYLLCLISTYFFILCISNNFFHCIVYSLYVHWLNNLLRFLIFRESIIKALECSHPHLFHRISQSLYISSWYWIISQYLMNKPLTDL